MVFVFLASHLVTSHSKPSHRSLIPLCCVFTWSPGRALIHVFNNPYATEGYLSWGCLSKKLEFFTPY